MDNSALSGEGRRMGRTHLAWLGVVFASCGGGVGAPDAGELDAGVDAYAFDAEVDADVEDADRIPPGHGRLVIQVVSPWSACVFADSCTSRGTQHRLEGLTRAERECRRPPTDGVVCGASRLRFDLGCVEVDPETGRMARLHLVEQLLCRAEACVAEDERVEVGGC